MGLVLFVCVCVFFLSIIKAPNNSKTKSHAGVAAVKVLAVELSPLKVPFGNFHGLAAE